VGHLLQAEITGMRQDAGIEMRQQGGPQRLSTGGVDKVVREMCPGIDLNKEFTQFHLGKACRDEVLQGFRASGPVFCFQGRQNDRVVLNTDMTVFASSELLDLGHTGFEGDLPLDQTLQPLAWGPRLTDHFEAATRPLRTWNEIGIRISIPPTVFDPDTP
jgi:hypothetical protein